MTTPNLISGMHLRLNGLNGLGKRTKVGPTNKELRLMRRQVEDAQRQENAMQALAAEQEATKEAGELAVAQALAATQSTSETTAKLLGYLPWVLGGIGAVVLIAVFLKSRRGSPGKKKSEE